MLDIRSFFNEKKCKRDKKNNNYWVNAARVLLVDDGISADEGFVD